MDDKVKCAPVTVEAIQKAYQVLKDQKIVGVLIGTSALWMLSFDVTPGDIDFLVLKAPKGDDLQLKLAKGSTEESATGVIDGVKVDYIPASGLRQRYFTNGAGLWVEDVYIAPLHNILGLKRLADRQQDRDFLFRWSYGLVGIRRNV
jgi:hypothetical protein